MHDRDCLHRFLFEDYPIRGYLVHLDASWRALLEHRTYPQSIRDTLGEAVAASVLLAATLKFDGTLSLQLKGRGPMHLMIAQCSSQLGVRAVARYREEVDERDLVALSGDGNLTVTLENDDLTQRYQGIVPLAGERLSECLRDYFENSEQLPTRLWLHADEQGASGLLLQRLSDDTVAGRQGTRWVSNAAVPNKAVPNQAEIADAWNRVQLLGDTLQPSELKGLSDQAILRRLFAEDDVRLFESAPVFFRCRCSRERVEGMLRALGADEVRSIIEERGNVEVHCDFCNRGYVFDPVDAEQLLAAPSATDASTSLH
ncbi:MAG TPA: Hsp33 family molecular chaperone HslO [Steroidobacteraceae bacterium]|nr:Hsp33 family molecular chaperone HslO [Steroidobacteraceae bacterium]